MLLSGAQNECAKPKCVTQSNLSNADTEGTEQSVRTGEVTMMTSLLRPHWQVRVFIHWMDNETVWITPFVSNCQLLHLYRTALTTEIRIELAIATEFSITVFAIINVSFEN